MKKIIVFVSIIALVLSFASCGSKSSGFDTSKNISVTAREDGSGTKSAYMELIGLKGKADPANVVIQTGTAAVLAEVKNNPSAIAYESLGYITDDVKSVSVNGVAANADNIKNGTYKLSRPLSVVYKDSNVKSGLNKAFLAFLGSKDAQSIISDNKYVSIYDTAPEYTIDSTLSGSIDVSGSTSLQPLMIKLAAEYEKLQPNVKVTVSGGGSGTGYKNAENGTSAFGMISAVFDKTNAPSCVSYTVAKDGIAVIVNKQNTISNITVDQLKAIYNKDAGKDAITTWSQLIK
ncbi:MAG: extracellular solute-binding protein [Bacillota bacterium]|nr:extracellular solute-binding protein [Bacillota bacterium]